MVSKPLAAPWRVEIRVPVARPVLVSRIVVIAHDTLRHQGVTRDELVLTPAREPGPPVESSGPVARRLRVA